MVVERSLTASGMPKNKSDASLMVSNSQEYSGKQLTKLVAHVGGVQRSVFPRVYPLPLHLLPDRRQNTISNAWIIPKFGLIAMDHSITANGTRVKKIYVKTLVVSTKTSA